MVVITRRNTRRYGGYLIHIGVVLVIIGFAGLPFNQDKEQEMGLGDKMQIGHYTLVCESYAEDPRGNTQDSRPNYDSQWAVLDVYKNGKYLGQMFPEQRFYTASQQTSTIVANRSRPNEDLYLVYTGRNPDTQQADHQGTRESAGAVDLDWRPCDFDWHDHCADSEHEAAARGAGEGQGSRAGGGGASRSGWGGGRLGRVAVA